VALFEGAGEWVDKAPLPEKTSDLQSVACSGKIYVLGGLSGGGGGGGGGGDGGGDDNNNSTRGGVLSSVLEYDPFYETVVAKSSMPIGRFRFGAACLGDEIYVVGGFSSKADGDSGASLRSMHRYSTRTDTWHADTDGAASATGSSGGGSGGAVGLAGMSVARGDLSLVAVAGSSGGGGGSGSGAGKLYAFGGYGVGYDMSVSGTLTEEYDVASNTWSVRAPMSQPRGDCVAAVASGRVYVVGGWDAQWPPRPVGSLEVYDPASDTWATGPPLSAARGDPAVAVMGGRVFVVGGEAHSADVPCGADGGSLSGCWVCGACVALHGVEMYDPATGVWVGMAPFPGSRFRFSAAAANGAIFTFGGHTAGEVATASVSAYFWEAAVGGVNLFAHSLLKG
jgi:hypothetical protein